jgi:hypothetical protein
MQTFPTDDRSIVSAVRPYFIGRVAGMPLSSIAVLRSERTLNAVSALDAADAAIADACDPLAERLHGEIPAIEDRTVRNRVLQLRRDLFNGRVPRTQDLEAGHASLSPDLWLAVSEHVERQRQRSRLAETFTELFSIEVARTRTAVQCAVADGDFVRGLLASSQTLYGNIERYRRAPAASMSSRDEQIERGLLRYLTRAATKATPFATFCAVVPGRLHESLTPARGAGAIRLTGDPRRKRSHVRLNKLLFSTLWGSLKMRPAVRARLIVELTPTLTREGDALRFLAESDGRETFQRLTVNDALDAIVPLLRRQSGTSLQAAIDALVHDPRIDASAEEATAYLDELIRVGLLRFRTGVADQDPDWDAGIASFLHRVDDPSAQEAADLLRALRDGMESYARAGADARVAIAGAMRDRIAALAESWRQPIHALKGIVYHEDATADAELQVDVDGPMRQALDRLTEWAALVGRIAAQRPEQGALRHFFDAHYGSAERGVPLLQFYEDFYREHFKEHLQRLRDADRGKPRAESDPYDLANPFSLVFVANWHRARAAMTEVFRAAWAQAPEAIEVSVSADDVRRALDPVPELPCEARSLGVFCDLVPARDGEPARAILKKGAVLTGRGKYFSRFLYMLPDDLRASVFADNNANPNEWRAEICADSNFNANLHPPLLQWEISYPTAESGGSDHQLACADLAVVRSPNDAHALHLVHGHTGRRVVPFDLGFLNPHIRPPLFQLLSRFAPLADAAVQLPDALPADASDAAAPTPRIHYRPRMTFERSVVLSRRRWLVPSELFPRQARHEDDAAYFQRIRRWRTEHGLPEQIYFRIQPIFAGQRAPQPEVDPEAAPEERAADEAETPRRPGQPRGPRDFDKPQFIDFGAPLLVKLLAHAPRDLERFVMIVEERLPEACDLVEAAGERYATELILQLEVGAPAFEEANGPHRPNDATPLPAPAEHRAAEYV